jgi:predicted nucleotidyltransferase
MNFHSDSYIMDKVLNHYTEAISMIPERNVVGVFLQGSQNYGLEHENSDIDTKCITTPTFKEIALAYKPRSTTHIRENNEHIDLKDVRLYMTTFRKQNLNFLEILYTPYFIIRNFEYQKQWNRLIEHREEITHYNPVRSVKSMMGIASEKYFAMEHHYPSRMTWIEKFGYDPKQLHHLLRVEEYLDRYLAGEPYGDCLISKKSDYLKDVKMGYYNLEDAREIANKSYNHIHNVCDDFVEKHKNDPVDSSVDFLLDDIAYQIMKHSVINDLFTVKEVISVEIKQKNEI